VLSLSLRAALSLSPLSAGGFTDISNNSGSECDGLRAKTARIGCSSRPERRLVEPSEVFVVRVLCLLLIVILSGSCSALEIRRVAACAGVVLRLRGDFKEGDYARFKSHFRKKNLVIGLDLSSDGGDLEEGVQIANLAHQKSSVFMLPKNGIPFAHLSSSRWASGTLPKIRELASIRYLIVGTSKT
jgi:hypothetical protein